MAKLVECIPNFSTADKGLVDKLVEAAQSVAGVTLMDASSDASHNRSVFTLVGTPEGVEEVSVRLAKIAIDNIDMNKHTGEHPRMGAMDVCPYVPVKDVTMEECIEISKKVGERLWNELKLPVTLYEASATAPHRENLAAIRKGQYEAMAEKLKEAEWKPDYGTDAPHPTAGLVAVGARMPLVAFNVNLNTSDVNIASNIAKIIRNSGGGFKYCKGIGVMLEERNIAQVSMNMVNYEGTPLYRVFETIKMEAARYGVGIVGSEIIGLTPGKALVDCAEYYLQIEEFDYSKQVMENHLLG